MVNTKQDIIHALRDSGVQLRALGVARIGLFGSFIQGKQRPDSDVDLLVAFEPDRQSSVSMSELSSFLNSLLQRRIELVTLESVSPYLARKILDEVEYIPLAA